MMSVDSVHKGGMHKADKRLKSFIRRSSGSNPTIFYKTVSLLARRQLHDRGGQREAGRHDAAWLARDRPRR